MPARVSHLIRDEQRSRDSRKVPVVHFFGHERELGTEPEPLEQGTERWRWFADADRETRAAHPRTIIIGPRATAAQFGTLDLRSPVAAVHAMFSAMDQTVTVLERAFQLAKSGSFATVDAIGKQLKAEGYSVNQITGRVLRAQLIGLIKAARGKGHV
jgi:hypothetical protein